MKISYEQVQAFVAVADSGSFSAAAKTLGKHRTTLGQVITNLEDEINVSLFDRSGRYPTLTDHGLALYQQAKSLAVASSAFEQLCLYQDEALETELRVYYSEQIPELFISNVMIELRKKYRGVRVHWLQAHNSEILSKLESNQADLAIVIHPTGDAVTSIDFTLLANMPYTLCASPTFIRKNRPSDLSSLQNLHQLTLLDYEYSNAAKTLCLSNLNQKLSRLSILLQLLRAGEGWSALPSHSVKEDLILGSLQELPIKELSSRLHFPVVLWTKAKIMGPCTAFIVELAKKYAHLFEEI